MEFSPPTCALRRPGHALQIMPKHVVATVDEIPAGKRKIVQVQGRSVGIFNLNGSYFALRNTCAHQGGPLCLGPIGSLVQAARPGEYALSRPGEMVRCPWHGWEYDIRTGQSWWTGTRVRSYPVSVESGATREGVEWRPGPYVVDTYPVSIEKQYVVVEIPA
jgi:3-phenylpropionate/trans-cinnamate dioxygenase ferredoxin subunit